MKRKLYILSILSLFLLLTACNYVSSTSSQELVSNSWTAVTANGIKAFLDFDIKNSDASFTILLSEDESVSIKGKYTADDTKLYIVCEDFFDTYIFDYQVYNDKLVLSHNNKDLEFFPKNKESHL